MNTPSTTTLASIDALLDRARRLRRLARDLGDLAARRLPGMAGADTWRGPRPDLCRAMLDRNLRQIERRIDELLEMAHGLERRAESAQTTIRLGGL